MGVGQEQRHQGSLSSFHISQQIVDVMHISLSRGARFSIQACVLLGHYKDFILDLAVPFPFE